MANNIEFYDENGYKQVHEEMQNLLRRTDLESLRLQKPSEDDKRRVRSIIEGYIRTHDCKVYGGTSQDQTIKEASKGKDVIYDDPHNHDIEIYSIYPRRDMRGIMLELATSELTRYILDMDAGDARHEDTYNIRVGGHVYCDISYVPEYIYHKIPTKLIEGIQYVHPNFSIIDMFRIFTDPVNSARFKWEKVFNRFNIIQKWFPFKQYTNFDLKLAEPTEQVENLIQIIIKQFWELDDIDESCLLVGIAAYNYYVRYINKSSSNVLKRLTKKNIQIGPFPVPFLEILATEYLLVGETIYELIKSNVDNPSKLRYLEYPPFFQFFGMSLDIYYDNNLIVRIFQCDGRSLPRIGFLNKKLKYASYQLTYLHFMQCKFRMMVNKNNKDFDSTISSWQYARLLSNLLSLRNEFLNNLPKEFWIDDKPGPVNNSPTTDFVTKCIGESANIFRESALRRARNPSSMIKFLPKRYLVNDSYKEKMDNVIDSYNYSNLSGNKLASDSPSRVFKLENGILRRKIQVDYGEGLIADNILID